MNRQTNTTGNINSFAKEVKIITKLAKAFRERRHYQLRADHCMPVLPSVSISQF